MTLPRLTSDNWIKYHSNTAKGSTTLFCFPYSGAGALAYKNWQDSLPSNIALAAVQLPGRETRFSESSYDELQPLINDLGQAIVPHLTQSFAFFGHSFGSLLAFELTAWLKNNNHPVPDRLFISSFRAPPIPAQKPHTYDLPRNELIEKLKTYNGTDSSILKNEELIDIFLPALRADLKICENYHSRQPPALKIPITIYFGERDEHIPPETLDGWELCTTHPLEFKKFRGDHFYLNTEERYELIDHLAKQIAR
ncbi:thioesterase [Pseudomonas sp. S75]|uniref:thioesterase II family protein n=1 Tax=unclassified Pseudomonas TaxID=196821 RepID=UPI001903F0C6|nr:MULTISPECIES: thioesterase [unclassified Pseudomonas]MBJ9976495.1 thioesterase [Pseudomonas sp. S30]MBK0156289.1 thioesterase [Pseudomonas sp. S75]